MGVLNVTPDSFSDGGDFLSPDAALARAEAMLREGAAIIDIGGESTRPGAEPVSADVELARVLPVIERLHARLPEAVISIDTMKPEVMRAAVAAGAAMINDVAALRAGDALAVAAASGAAVCLMHMKGEPRTMQREPRYDDVVTEVRDFLAARVEACVDAGIGRERLLVDPGFGFGKGIAHNLELLAGLGRIAGLGLPVLVGLSRKSLIPALLGERRADERLYASIALATLAAWQGAAIVRAHDVRATVDALAMVAAVGEESRKLQYGRYR